MMRKTWEWYFEDQNTKWKHRFTISFQGTLIWFAFTPEFIIGRHQGNFQLSIGFMLQVSKFLIGGYIAKDIPNVYEEPTKKETTNELL